MASKFKKARQKALGTIKSATVKVGFSDIDTWIDMGNFAMNRIMGGNFRKGLLFGRNYVYYGESGSGKSLQAAYAAASAQRNHDAAVLWIDVEKATDGEAGKRWLARAGVDIEHEEFEYATAATLGDIKKVVSEMCQIYSDVYTADEKDRYDKPLLIVVDSWSAALTQGQWDQAQEGILKGDMGQKAKQTGDVVQAITHLCSHLPVMVVGVGHIMDNQNTHPMTGAPIGGKHKTTGGHKMFYMASGCMMFSKKDLLGDDVDDQEVAEYYAALKKGMTATLAKRKQVIGHVCVVDNLKSRSSKPHQRIEVQVPFNTGMDPYSGLMDLLIVEGAVTVPSAGWYQYGGEDGPKFRAKDFREHADAAMEWADQLNPNGIMRPLTEEEVQAALAEEDEANE